MLNESVIDNYYYHEAWNHLNDIKNFFEQEVRDEGTTAECFVAFGLVSMKIGDINACFDYL